jgi:hypothetical protein
MFASAAFDEAVSNHEAHEGHEEILSYFASFAVRFILSLRALRVLRGDISVLFFSCGVAALGSTAVRSV